jgi:hypothetical protein
LKKRQVTVAYGRKSLGSTAAAAAPQTPFRTRRACS